jgi:hypothetical protein
MPWQHGDLTAQVDAPDIAGELVGYSTCLAGEGPVARVLYMAEDQQIHELSLSGRDAGWKHTDLTDQADAPTSAGSLVGYTTSLNGQGPVARVLYLGAEDGDIHELLLVGGGRWKHGNLTEQSGAPAAAPSDALAGYTTSLGGEGPRARVVYRDAEDNDVHELRQFTGDDRWRHLNLSQDANSSTVALSGPVAYTTNLGAQGHVPRVVYLGADGRSVHELWLTGSGHWRDTNLIAEVHVPAPDSIGPPVGYSTDLSGQGPRARVLYLSFDDQHVHELSLSTFGADWEHTDLTAAADAPLAIGPLVGYTTGLGGQGPVARVLYKGFDDEHVHELRLSGGSRWRHTDLTDLADGPSSEGALAGYTTCLKGQGPVARVLYDALDRHIHELFTFG